MKWTPFLFHVGAVAFVLEAPFSSRHGRFGLTALFWFLRRPAQELDETLDGIFTVALLGTESIGFDGHDAIVRYPVTRQLGHPSTDVFRQRRRAAGVEAELHRGRYFVDVLTAWASRAYELHLELGLVDGEVFGDVDHPSRVPGVPG